MSAPRRLAPPGSEDLIVFSHLRWNFVFQRPQHLLTRFARRRRVFFFEEPMFDAGAPSLEMTQDASGVIVCVPHLVPGTGEAEALARQRTMLDRLLRQHAVRGFVTWYYTPMALRFSDHLASRAVVYDCMDELSAFAGAPQGLTDAERLLMRRASVVFTGGASLYESKRRLHPNVHAFPSSVDVAHFARARTRTADPADQAGIGSPRLGFFGVVDERFDIPLVAAVAERRPDWHVVVLGPVVKIDPASLPRPANVHYLGQKSYAELPQYIAGWDVALLPFARNEATRFISPTKTPEYLAAGRPVVSTSIRDVVRPYGEQGLVRIADTPDDFIAAVAAALAEEPAARQAAVDALLSRSSWDATWAAMDDLICEACEERRAGASADPARSTAGDAPAAAI